MPIWCKYKSKDIQLLTSDDTDALLCYIMQHYYFNRELHYFIDMSSERAYKGQYGKRYGKQYFYADDKANWNKSDILALDTNLRNFKSWDNHIVKINKYDEVNKNSANLNIALDICKDNYKEKACVSSIITMLSYYDFDLKQWSKEQLLVLCAIDSLYYPFTVNYFIDRATYNLKLLEYDFLKDFILTNMQEIKNIEKLIKIKEGHITVNQDGHLTTDINLQELSKIFNINVELPNNTFTLKKTFKSQIFETNTYNTIKSFNNTVFNIALTYGKSGVVSFI